MKPFDSLSRLLAPPGRCGGEVRREAEAVFAGFVRTLGRLAVVQIAGAALVPAIRLPVK